MAKPAGKKPKGGKAKKQRATEHKKRIKAATGAPVSGGGDDGGKDLGLAPAGKGGHQRNPKAFVFSGRGKAKRQAARSAEKDQRRMHGAVTLALRPAAVTLGLGAICSPASALFCMSCSADGPRLLRPASCRHALRLSDAAQLRVPWCSRAGFLCRERVLMVVAKRCRHPAPLLQTLGTLMSAVPVIDWAKKRLAAVATTHVCDANMLLRSPGDG